MMMFNALAVEDMIRANDVASLLVFRAGFAAPCNTGQVDVTTVDKLSTSLIPADVEALPQGSDSDDDEYNSDDDDDDSMADEAQGYTWLAHQTTVNSDCLYSAVSFALTGKACHVQKPNLKKIK